MIKKFTRGSVTALVLMGAASMGSNAIASPGDMGSWGGGMDKHHAHMGDGDKKGSWDGGGNMMMGMESGGHMTARLRKVWNLDLSADQRKKIRDIQRDLRAKTWEHEDAIENVSDKLFELYKVDERDAKAIGKVYGEIFDHKRQIIELQIEAGNKVEATLTKEQRGSLNSWGQKPKWGSGWGK